MRAKLVENINFERTGDPRKGLEIGKHSLEGAEAMVNDLKEKLISMGFKAGKVRGYKKNDQIWAEFNFRKDGNMWDVEYNATEEEWEIYSYDANRGIKNASLNKLISILSEELYPDGVDNKISELNDHIKELHNEIKYLHNFKDAFGQ